MFVTLMVTASHGVWCQETVQAVSSNGRSGTQCARSGRRCLFGTRCVKTAGRCECPPGETGNAEFECAKQNEHLCLLSGDPITRVVAFGGAANDVNIPCTFRATRFITPMAGSRSYCSVEVHVTSAAYGDTYRLRAVHVAVGLTEPRLQVQSNVEAVVTGSHGVNGSDGYTYTVRTTPVDVFSYGSGIAHAEEKRRQTIIVTSVDDVNNMVVLTVPACSTRIKFRGYDPTVVSTQPLLPGVAIVTPKTAEFYDGYGTYPYSLCGTPADRSNMFQIPRLGGDVTTSVVAAVLSERPPQFENTVSDQCQIAMSLYGTSPNRMSDVDACAFLLTKKVLIRCLQSSSLVPIDVFNACLLQRQKNDDVNACTTLYLATSRCGSKWTGPKEYCGH